MESSENHHGIQFAIIFLVLFGISIPCFAQGDATLGGVGVRVTENPNTYPILRIVNKETEPTLRCTGTMIGPRVIITAAHCLDGPTKKLSIYLGKEKDKANIIEADCSAHPMFFLNLNQTADFALCRLAEEIPGKDTSYEWLTTDHRVMVAAERLQLSGFGCKDDSEFNKPIKAEQAILRDGPAPLRNFGFVFASSGFQDNFLTVIDEGDGVYLCSGDSGGVVYVNLDNRGDVDNISQRLTGTRVVVAVNSALVSGDHRISLVARTTGSDFQKFLFDWMAKNPGLNICDYDRPDSEDLKVCRAMR